MKQSLNILPSESNQNQDYAVYIDAIRFMVDKKYANLTSGFEFFYSSSVTHEISKNGFVELQFDDEVTGCFTVKRTLKLLETVEMQRNKQKIRMSIYDFHCTLKKFNFIPAVESISPFYIGDEWVCIFLN